VEISQRGIDRIVAFEGKNVSRLPDGRYQAYLDMIAKPPVWTIYCGLTKSVYSGMTITEAEGERLYAKELAVYEDDVRKAVSVDLNQNEFDACVSFTYNCGGGAFARSIAPVINAGRKLQVPAAMAQWCHCGGKVVQGLVNRRKAEGSWFLEPDSNQHEPMPQRPEQAVVPTTTAIATAAKESPSFWAALVGMGATVAKGAGDVWSWFAAAATDAGDVAGKAKDALSTLDPVLSLAGANMGLIAAATVTAAFGVVIVRKVGQKKAAS
jgi:lysozyme